MPVLRSIAATRDRGFALFLRVGLAADLLLDSARALQWRSHIGTSRLEDSLPASLTRPAAVLELAVAAALCAGLFTRPAAAITAAMVFPSALIAYRAIGGLGSDAALTAVAHAALMLGAAGFLVAQGGGAWSVDAVLSRPRTRRPSKR